MLSVFRTNQLLVSFLLLFYAAAVHAYMLVSPTPAEAVAGGIFHEWLSAWIPAGMLWQAGIVTFLVFLQGFLLNVMEYNYRMQREVNMFPGVFFVLLASFSPHFLKLSPVHFANLFLFFALYEMMNVFKKKQAAGNIFNAGFFLGVAALFYPTYLIFTFLLFAGLNVMRGMIFKERLMVVSGVLTAYFLAGSIAFQLGQWQDFTGLQFSDAYAFFDLSGLQGWPWEFIPWIVLLLIVIFVQGEFLQKQTIQTQKRITLWYWMLFIILFTIPFQRELTYEHALVFALPLSLLSSMYFTQLRSNWAELWHALLLIALLLIQYQPLLFKYLS